MLDTLLTGCDDGMLRSRAIVLLAFTASLAAPAKAAKRISAECQCEKREKSLTWSRTAELLLTEEALVFVAAAWPLQSSARAPL